ncbi:Putative tartrate transporter [Paraburkholderia domus]|uniref:Tartrate transporter n=1 Tax=Paraburkholderia domus TaxID=2793075 RepID=A0A9N8QSM0_9BURK|nr:MFS transporter [Paraburkholderia domus]MBK5053588.1 MFS transporter [Burkholderia sp. R-70006]MBK5064872.1 MFS transporter [Burkholderia sp. R-70199]MBK5090859.1 MFS transporter [Burkholderia sp. R-69927]MBK5125630.1 MFS transporter [Burkholderia sp. R-69980]MBK5168500.1 MFS transporter [Burkholderia sp. R-70211]MBK5183809.1 MFS transporter [Burkholderia sp. R-69749]MCI0144358.1 MFS transporter [Paraburkholderia sediminicola]
MSQSHAPALEPGASAAAHDDLLYRKVSMRIIPFLFLCYVVSFLDRINIGFAQLQMKHDLGFSDAMYGLGAAVFYVGYVLCEVPSNMLLARFGARRTFTRIMLLWGIASVGMMLVSKPTHFYVLRFMLGVFEAGFFPGIVLYLTYWYPARRRAAVLSIFFAGVAVAGVLGGLVSGWIMRDMGGVMGLFGWQWMFVIEGAPAIVLGLLAAFYLVDGPQHATWLNAAEKAQLIAQRDEDRRVSSDAHSSRSVMQSLRNPRVYLFAFIYFSLTCASLTLNFWMPLMIRDFGVHDVLAISLYTVIPNAVGAVGLILIARNSDRRGERRRHFAVCTIGGGIALSLLTLHLSSFPAMLAILSLAAVLIFAALPIFWTVPSGYLSGTAAAAGIALISSIGITSGIVSPWVIGLIKTHTGSMDNALYLLTALLFVSGVALLVGVPKETKRI